MTSRSSKPTTYPLANDIDTLSIYENRKYLHKEAVMIVDTFVFDKGSFHNNLVEDILTAQEKQYVLSNQQLSPDGQFPCRFPGCPYTYKFDCHSRKKHESMHGPSAVVPVVVVPDVSSSLPELGTSGTAKADTKQDDVPFLQMVYFFSTPWIEQLKVMERE